MKMSKYKRICYPQSSSSSDYDGIPLSPVKRDRNPERELYRYEEHHCEFCDAVCYSKYDILTHNAHHIIIPLRNQTVYQCTECLFHFTSQEELLFHSATKHGITSSSYNKKIITTKTLTMKKSIQNTVVKKEAYEDSKSNEILKSIVKNRAVVSCDDIVNKLIKRKDERNIECLVEKQPVVQCEDTVNEMLKNVAENKMDVAISDKQRDKDGKCKKKEKGKGKKDKKKLPKQNGGFQSINEIIDLSDEDSKMGCAQNNENTESLKNKIVFEDDSDIEFIDNDVETPVTSTTIADNLVNNLPIKDIEVLGVCNGDDVEKPPEDFILPDNDYIFNRILVPDNSFILPDNGPEFIVPDLTPAQNCQNSVKTEPFFSKILLGTKVTQDNSVTSTVEFRPSVHYKDLLAPGLYACKRCKKKFPDRFRLIYHEKIHIKFKSRIAITEANDCPICDRYITGNRSSLKRHIKKKHPEKPDRTYSLSLCKKCNLRYRKYSQHEDNYHKIYVCHRCGYRFEKDVDRWRHVQDNLCEDLRKSLAAQAAAESMIEHKTVKVLKVCEICHLFMKDSPMMKYVDCGESSKLGERQRCERCRKEVFELKLVKRIHKYRKGCDEWKKKGLSNDQRLKNIQHRLKKFNKLSQC